MVVEPSISGHGFEVGDMVWAKMKSQPWWPGHVYNEEFATPLVRQSKRGGMLLVAFFGASSYGWFDPSELVPFDSNYAEKSVQTNSRTFVKAVEDAVVEVNRRVGLGMSCMCRNKQNFRKIDVQGFVVVDVAGHDSGAVYSMAAIGKARDSFQPNLALDFLKQLALEPTSSEHDDDIDFIKNKATVLSYRKAVYDDERYGQAFGRGSVHASVQEPASQEASSKAPDSLGKVKNTAKLKDRTKKDEYLFKRRDDDSKEIKTEKEKVASSSLLVSFKDPTTAGETSIENAARSLEDTPPIVIEFDNSCSERSTSNGESLTSSSVAESDQAKVQSAHNDSHTVVNGPKKVKIPKRPVGELEDGISLAEMFLAKKTGQRQGPQKADLSRLLGDLHSLAVDPFNTVNRESRIKGKKAFLRFRSLVFRKSKNFSLPLADGDPNARNSSEDNVQVPPVKPPSGLKRGPSDCQEEVIVAKKKVGDIRKLTGEKNITNKVDEYPARDVKQPIATTLKKSGPGPTKLILKFPQGGYLPSFNELKARFACYGPLDHSATQILRNTFSCQVVFRQNAHAQAAYKSVVGSTSLFGNTDVKCSLKDVGDVDAADPEPSVKVPKGHHQPAMKDRPPSMVPAASTVQLKSVLKKSGGEEAAGKGGREVYSDNLGNAMNTAKSTDHAKKDGYLFKPRDESKEVVSLVEQFSAKKRGQPEGPRRSDDNNETGLLQVLDVLHSLAVDPFNTVSRGSLIKGRKALLRFRSCVFQKGQNFSLPLAGGDPNAGKSSEDSVEIPPVKPPTGLKRGPSDRQEEMAAAKKKRVGDIKILTKKKVTKMIDEPPARVVNQPVVSTVKKPGPELIQRAPEPTMLTIKFPKGGSLPSYNELKAKFTRYGPMDHSATHIFWNTYSCQVVFRHKAHAQAAYRFVVGSTSLFGNTGVKCTLKAVGTVSSAKPEPEPLVEVREEHHNKLPGMEGRPRPVVPDTSGLQPKSILKKSGGEEAAGSGGKGRVKFMDVSSKKYHPSAVTSPTGSSTTTPPLPSMHYVTTLLSPPPPSLPPLPSCSTNMTPLQILNRPLRDPLTKPNMDFTQQMLSLLTRCHDVVTNVTSILGYTPYHPL